MRLFHSARWLSPALLLCAVTSFVFVQSRSALAQPQAQTGTTPSTTPPANQTPQTRNPSVTVQCAFLQPQTPPQTTVTVRLKPILSPDPDPLIYEFRIISTGQISTFSPGETATPPDFRLSVGAYDLSLKRRYSPHSRSLWIGIDAPASVATNGRGTGCRLLAMNEGPAAGERPAIKREGRQVGP